MTTQVPAPRDTDSLDPHVLRADFPILATRVGEHPLVYFDSAASTQRPRQVISALTDVYEKHYANVHRGIHFLSERSTELYEQARESVRALINAASSEEIIFTAGTTAAINMVARSWGEANVKPGDVIVLTEMEHHSNLVPWQQLAARNGAVLRHIPITDDGYLVLDHLDELLAGPVKMVALAAVSNTLGTINPVAEITRRAHAAGALVLVDAAQSVPHLATDVQALGADFLACSGHKMLGASGVGVLYGRRELLEAMPAFLGGGSMINEVFLDRFTPAELPAKFEAGTPPIAPAIALGAAIDYLQQVGFDRIHQHELLLTRRAHEVLAGVPGIRIIGPAAAEHKAGIVSFVHEKHHPHDIAQVLNDHFGIAVRPGHHCTQPLHDRLGLVATTRASFYLYNTLDEVDLLGEALRAVPRVLTRRRRA